MELLLATVTPEIHEKLKLAVALGRWADGTRLSREQLEQSMQLVILYEARYLPEAQRTGAPLKKPAELGGDQGGMQSENQLGTESRPVHLKHSPE